MAAVATKQNGRPLDSAEGVIAKGTEFPKATLEESIRVADAIERANAGQPYPPLETANAMGLSPASSLYRTLLSASSRRGLTSGAHTSKKITVLETGRDLVAPTTRAAVAAARRKAALTPPVFRAVYTHYRGKRLPEDQYLVNTLTREFGVPAKDADRFAKIFRADMEYAGLLVPTKTGYFLTDDLEGVSARIVAPVADETETEDDGEGSSGVATSEVLAASPPVVSEEPKKPQRPKAIFVGHGPDKTALSQLTKILDEWGLPYKIAEYEPNAFRPVSQKVADLMNECGAAILVFTADRELRDTEGNPVWLSSANVSHELGAASVLYDGRVVVFKESSVDLASNYAGIGFIEFEKNKLSAHAMELFREIREFGLIKISVGE